MQRLLVSLTLIAALFWLSLPTAIAQEQTAPTQEDLQAAFENELTAYAATHTADEVAAYAQLRMDQMTNEALNFDPTSTQGAAVSMAGSAELQSGDIFIYPDLWDNDDGSNDAQLRFCLETRGEECRRDKQQARCAESPPRYVPTIREVQYQAIWISDFGTFGRAERDWAERYSYTFIL